MYPFQDHPSSKGETPRAMCGLCYKSVTPEKLLPAPCSEHPETLVDKPIGMYHCPDCGAMLCAGVPHPHLCTECYDKVLAQDTDPEASHDKEHKDTWEIFTVHNEALKVHNDELQNLRKEVNGLKQHGERLQRSILLLVDVAKLLNKKGEN